MSRCKILEDIVDQISELLNAHLYTNSYSCHLTSLDKEHYAMLRSLFRIISKTCSLLSPILKEEAMGLLNKQINIFHETLFQMLQCSLQFYFMNMEKNSLPFQFLVNITSEIENGLEVNYCKVRLMSYFEQILQESLSQAPMVSSNYRCHFCCCCVSIKHLT